MDEEMMQMAAMEQALGGGGMPPAPMGAAPMGAPADPMAAGSAMVTIEVPEFALPYIAELLSSLIAAEGGGAPMGGAPMGGAPMGPEMMV